MAHAEEPTARRGPSRAPARQGGEDLQTAVLWSTPAAQDAKNSTSPQAQETGTTLCRNDINGTAAGETSSGNVGTPARGMRWERQAAGWGGAYRTDTYGSGGQLNPDWVDCLMGISARLDAQRGWPASKGQPHFDWEPPRTGYGIPDRTKRLTGGRHAVVPQQFTLYWRSSHFTRK
jgi:hypothetical protein